MVLQNDSTALYRHSPLKPYSAVLRPPVCWPPGDPSARGRHRSPRVRWGFEHHSASALYGFENLTVKSLYGFENHTVKSLYGFYTWENAERNHTAISLYGFGNHTVKSLYGFQNHTVISLYGFQKPYCMVFKTIQ